MSLDPGIVDTAQSGTDVGQTDLTGALPHDTLGAVPPPAGSQPMNLGETAQQRIDAEKAAQNALAGQLPATTTTTTPTAGLPVDPSVYAYGGGKASIGNKIVQAAEHYLNVPYVWGGESATGVDCSGLVALAYKAAGIALPRVSYQQAAQGTRVSSMKNLRPGDLVGWDNSTRNPGADHIAVYLGGGMIIEAAHPGTNVRIRRLSPNENAMYFRMGW